MMLSVGVVFWACLHGVAVGVSHGGSSHTPVADRFAGPARGMPVLRAAFATCSVFPSGMASTRLHRRGGAGGDPGWPIRPRASLDQASGPLLEPPAHAESRFSDQVLAWLQDEQVLHKQVKPIPPVSHFLSTTFLTAFGTQPNRSALHPPACLAPALRIHDFCTPLLCSTFLLSSGRLHECRFTCRVPTVQSSLSASTISSSCTSYRRPAASRTACPRTRQPF
jgi:hypothetical protein